MSLINQMLHDLDKRNPPDMRSPAYVVAGLHSPRNSINSMSDRRRTSMVSIVLMGVLGLLLVAVIWRYASLLMNNPDPNSSVAISSYTPISTQKLTPAGYPDPVGEPLQQLTISHETQAGVMTRENYDNLTNDKPVESLADTVEPPSHLDTGKEPFPVIDRTASLHVAPPAEVARLESPPFTAQPENGMVQPVTKKPAIIEPTGQQQPSPDETEIAWRDNIALKKKFRPLTNEQRAESAYISGIAAIQRGDTSEGMDHFRNALSKYPGHIKAREILAGLLIKAGQYPEASRLLQEGIELHPDYSQFANLYARILVEEGNTREALKVLEANRPTLNDHPEYYALLAAVYQRLDKSRQAADIYLRLVTIRPENGIYWMGLGISLESDSKPVQAVEAYQRARASGTLNDDLLEFINAKIDTLKNIEENTAA